MYLTKLTGVVLLLVTCNIFAQDVNYSTLNISKELSKNANAVIRDHDVVIDINDFDDMTVTSKRVVTIFNKNGLKYLQPYATYNAFIDVKSLKVIVYDALGNEIDKYRKGDFKDYSDSGSSVATDERYLHLDYTPTQYPFTFEMQLEADWSTTVAIPDWIPIRGYLISTENTSYTINYQVSNDVMKIKEEHFSGFEHENNSKPSIINYSAKSIPAIKHESYAPPISQITPRVLVALNKFEFFGIEGTAKTWNEFGKWNYDNLLKGRTDLPQETINEVAELTTEMSDPVEKAKAIYKYVQDKTRYISVQIGVGGWQPILASTVEEVGYGDCKALTNYTKALMESQGIEANHTILYGSRTITNMHEEYMGIQGNHMILHLPNNGNPIWLECTDQKVPFGHIANFTDDRDVLVITPEGGRIEHTKAYSSKENYLKTMATVNIDASGGFLANINAKSSGTQYAYRLNNLVDASHKDQLKYYKENWDYVNGITPKTIAISNDKEIVEITEKLDVFSRTYATKVGSNLLINPNVFNRYTNVPPKYAARKLPFIIQRGFYDEDEFVLNIPDGYMIDGLLEPKIVNTKFGVYKVDMEQKNDHQIIYRRALEIKKGNYPKEDYKLYRSFIRKIAKADKSSFVLKKRI